MNPGDKISKGNIRGSMATIAVLITVVVVLLVVAGILTMKIMKVGPWNTGVQTARPVGEVNSGAITGAKGDESSLSDVIGGGGTSTKVEYPDSGLFRVREGETRDMTSQEKETLGLPPSAKASVRLEATGDDGIAHIVEYLVDRSTLPPDSDEDGLSDEDERKLGTNFNLTDTDGDGISDYFEVRSGTDPLNPKDPKPSK